MSRPFVSGSLAMLGLTVLALSSVEGRAAAEATAIDLTQTACQFVEIEGSDHGFTSAGKADCEAINASSGAERLAQSETLQLKPGRYVFRVKNENVPYELGFWLRGDGLINRATLPSVSGGGLVEGATQDYEIELSEGSYLFSCPLNPTPDYKIVVEG